MYLVSTPRLVQRIFPRFTWRVPTQEPVLYLTFDDGPIPELTPWVLDTLRPYGAKATFFCVGENVQRHPGIFAQLRAEGHGIGNHTHNHLNGWRTDTLPYLHNVRRCARLVPSRLFRPPYGRLRRQQADFLRRHFQVVLWDVLSGDFDPGITPQRCLQNVLASARPGSIVVLHDNVKATRNLQYALPGILDHFAGKGWRFERLAD
jgi:peptidoglycan/xylan/chitin deacetylase (PgdA/CDA1 family)